METDQLQVLDHLVFQFFKQINDIPRCSADEERIQEFLFNLGRSMGFDTEKDDYGNIQITKKADEGYEKAPRVILQGHMDMVCEKDDDSDHDFTSDPIKMIEDNGWIMADKTSLGADNAIGLSMALAALEEKNLGEIQVLITSSEETGMDGAIGLESDFLNADYLINLDSETEGLLTCSCAGGITSYLSIPIERKNEEKEKYHCFEIVLSGLRGGHSGMEIDSLRANSIKVMNQVLRKINEKVKLNIHVFEAGTKHNAIPNTAKVIISLMDEDSINFNESIRESFQEVKENYLKQEPDIDFVLKPADCQFQPLTNESRDRLFSIMELLPHGVYSMNLENTQPVTSDNLAILKSQEDSFEITLSIRSSEEDLMDELSDKIQQIAKMFKGNIEFTDGYPAWEYRENSELQSIFLEEYQALNQEDAEIYAIHAGLECGMFAKKNPSLDMVSFGPDIEGAHTTKEKVNIDSVLRSYQLLLNILRRISQ